MKILCTACSDLSKAVEIRNRGADEIILACKDQTFSAMKEYPADEIVSFLPQGHAAGLKISVLMNRLYGQQDITEGQDLLEYLLEHDVDNVYFADPGLFNEAVRLHRESGMIYDPGTLMTSAEDAFFWMEQGLASVVISPLITEEEILRIAEAVEHTTLIVHGHELMSVSKRHLLSAYRDVSGKKQEMDYNSHLTMREHKREGRMPVYENRYGMMVYTDFIQESFDEMTAFLESGVERFIIEDSFMNQNAFMDAVSAYRKILDGADPLKTGKEYRERYGDLPLSSGYYGQKTIR